MKRILLLLALSLTLSFVGAQNYQQQINMLRMDIINLKSKVDSLHAISYQCCCSERLVFITIDNVYWYESLDPEILNLEDRLPTEGYCNGSKAIAVTEDATIYCLYIPEGDGWIVHSHAKGGRSICPE